VGVCLVGWRNFVCSLLVVVVPTSLVAQDSAPAMLHEDGQVWLNRNPAPSSSAIFVHDLIETAKVSTAKIDTNGSTVIVQPETIVQYDGDELVLDHGSLQVDTSHGMKVRVNCLTVIPLTEGWTRYDVTDVDGKVTVVARENDVKIHYAGAAVRTTRQAGSMDVTVHQGEQATREERCGAAYKPSDAIDANGALLNNPWVVGTGVAAIAALTCWALCRSGNPVSPDKP
jgi:hypothetical protein